jgi:unsaturated rhamnogalacturonyl hydrolase
LTLCLTNCSQEETNPRINNEINWDTFSKMTKYAREVKITPDKFNYDWEDAVFLQALIVLIENNIDSAINSQYIKVIADKSYTRANGAIPNMIAPAVVYPYLYKVTGESHYLEKALKVYKDYKNIPKAQNKATSHTVKEVQLWDDTIFMTGIFLIQMYKATNELSFLNDYVTEVKGHFEYLYDHEYNLWYHGWDEDGIDNRSFQTGSIDGWTTPEDKNSDEFWGRGNGWIIVSIIDALSVMDPSSEDYHFLKEIYGNMIFSLSTHHDAQNGHWYNLINKPHIGKNFIESTSTVMYSYALLKGIRCNIISNPDFAITQQRSVSQGLAEYSLLKKDSILVPSNVCGGSSIGDEYYYFNRPIVSNTNFSLGLFILYGLEMKLSSLPL